MQKGSTSLRPRRQGRLLPAPAFTLLELIVTMAIMAIIIVSVGMIFQGATAAAGTSQALLEQMDGVRSIERMLQRDVGGMDKRGFLMIRSTMLDPSNPSSPRFDQVSFLAHGSFPNHTGADDPQHPFDDHTEGNAAHIWWGQLVMECMEPPNPSYMRSNQAAGSPELPTGVYRDYPNNRVIYHEEQCVLGRHVTVLLPGPTDNAGRIAPAGRVLMAYPSYKQGHLIQGAGESVPASIESSRFSVATSLPTMNVLPPSGPPLQLAVGSANPEPFEFPRTYAPWHLTGWVLFDWNKHSRPSTPTPPPTTRPNSPAPQPAGPLRFDESAVCFRFKALLSPYDTDVPENPFVNAAFRMQSIVMSGVSSVKIDWTDGKVDRKTGELLWYGPTRHSGNNIVEHFVSPEHQSPLDEIYTASFAGDWPEFWPTALRFTYHIVEPSHRLTSRDVVVVVALPD